VHATAGTCPGGLVVNILAVTYRIHPIAGVIRLDYGYWYSSTLLERLSPARRFFRLRRSPPGVPGIYQPSARLSKCKIVHVVGT
jgi:hypothetical protein